MGRAGRGGTPGTAGGRSLPGSAPAPGGPVGETGTGPGPRTPARAAGGGGAGTPRHPASATGLAGPRPGGSEGPTDPGGEGVAGAVGWHDSIELTEKTNGPYDGHKPEALARERRKAFPR